MWSTREMSLSSFPEDRTSPDSHPDKVAAENDVMVSFSQMGPIIIADSAGGVKLREFS
jgi:hypothetical protein